MSNKYDAFTGLRSAALSTASFLEATARRVRAGEIRQEEIVARIEDCATILREADAAADQKFFKLDPEAIELQEQFRHKPPLTPASE